MRAPVLTAKRARDLRRKMTLPEVLLWGSLRGGRVSAVKFRRQHPMGPYILDFFCPAASLAIEIDGEAHNTVEQTRHDRARTHWLNGRGVRVLRFAASDVLSDTNRLHVLETIARAVAPSTASRSPSPINGGGSE